MQGADIDGSPEPWLPHGTIMDFLLILHWGQITNYKMLETMNMLRLKVFLVELQLN